MARAAWNGVWKLKGLVNSEMHKLDNAPGPTSVTDAGHVDPMCKVAVGDTYTDRTGNSIYVRSLNAKGYLFWNSTSANPQTVRISVIIDTQQIGDTNPTWSDIYSSTSVVAHLNPLTVGRFKVLYDKVFSLSSDRPNISFEINKSMRHHVRYNGSANTDIQKGAIYLCYTSTQGTSNYPSLNYEARLSFHDN